MLCDFRKPILKSIQSAIKYTKWPENWPNGHLIYQHILLQDPPKFTRIWIFGLKIKSSGNPGTVYELGFLA
jgi:hypothetical protein